LAAFVWQTLTRACEWWSKRSLSNVAAVVTEVAARAAWEWIGGPIAAGGMSPQITTDAFKQGWVLLYASIECVAAPRRATIAALLNASRKRYLACCELVTKAAVVVSECGVSVAMGSHFATARVLQVTDFGHAERLRLSEEAMGTICFLSAKGEQATNDAMLTDRLVGYFRRHDSAPKSEICNRL